MGLCLRAGGNASRLASFPPLALITFVTPSTLSALNVARLIFLVNTSSRQGTRMYAQPSAQAPLMPGVQYLLGRLGAVCLPAQLAGLGGHVFDQFDRLALGRLRLGPLSARRADLSVTSSC